MISKTNSEILTKYGKACYKKGVMQGIEIILHDMAVKAGIPFPDKTFANYLKSIQSHPLYNEHV